MHDTGPLMFYAAAVVRPILTVWNPLSNKTDSDAMSNLFIWSTQDIDPMQEIAVSFFFFFIIIFQYKKLILLCFVST